jgi:hypothetical protein
MKITIIHMLMPVQRNSVTHLRVLLVLTDRGIEVVLYEYRVTNAVRN